MIWKFNDFNDNIAFVTEDKELISYRQVSKDSDDFFNSFGKRCLSFVLCTNCYAAVLGYISSVNNKSVPLLLDAGIDKELLCSLIETYKPDYIWLPENDNYFNLHSVYNFRNYKLLKTEYNNAYELNENLGLLLTTSGSTGSPKLVRQTYENIEANIKSIIQYLEITSSERPITTLPLNYTYGLSIVNSHLYAGASIILNSKTLFDRIFWDLLKDCHATSFGGVPYTYEMLNKLKITQMNLPSLRTMTQAGGKLSHELHKAFAEYAQNNGKKFVIMYGQVEATARMAYLPSDMSIEKIGSIGIAIPNGKFSLIDAQDQIIQTPNVTGELVYNGKNVTYGYAVCGDDLKKGDDFCGRLVTGDMAYFDEDGYFYISGRKKRFLKIYGNRVNLDETERMIHSAFPDCDCACAGKDDNLYIFVTDASLIDAVVKFASEKTGLNHIAFKGKFIDTIPRNESGKTKYSALEGYYV